MKTLLLIDLQNDFMPGGALAVPGGDAIIPLVNELMPGFDLVVATQDWHPADHGSFAVNHPGRSVFQQIELDGLPQTLWPVHCVQNTGGALFAPGLDTRRVERVFTKGTNPRIDSYSGFFDNGHRASTGMGEWLKARGVGKISVAGVATDYCVKFTVLDALAEGFEVELIAAACRGVDLNPGDVEHAVGEMHAAGAVIASRCGLGADVGSGFPNRIKGSTRTHRPGSGPMAASIPVSETGTGPASSERFQRCQ